MGNILKWSWCLLQTIVGYIVVLCMGATKFENGIYLHNKNCGSVSFGSIVILNNLDAYNKQIITHELGHSMQSIILGPLYLLVILIPSMVWYGIWTKWLRMTGISYYWFYTERWAEYYANLMRPNC